MTCEVLPPALSTRRARLAAVVASAVPVLCYGTRDCEIVLPDGTTCTAEMFPRWVEYATDWSGSVGPERQAFFDGILAIDAERKLAAMKVLSSDDEPVWRQTAKLGAIALIGCLILIATLAFGQDVSIRTDATLAQATQAQFVEYSPEAHQ